ncbi:MAG: Rieske 2Fe-2S domain-containing protein [Chloroflexota bacterium]
MLSRADNEFLCRIGPGTAMGDVLRQYWVPFLPTRDLPRPDSDPLRVKLLGEDLVAFRDTHGQVGLIQNNCPHRGASLFFGRNEEAGIRCVYHGWKFTVDGSCVDMPNEPAESDFKSKVRAVAYPCRDVNGMIWTYMGPGTPPDFPPFEINTLPADQVAPPHIMLEECNWVQGLEGDIDSSHIDWVHARLDPEKGMANGGMRGTYNRDRRPKIEVLPTNYGGCYSASRQWEDDGTRWHRITQFILPFHTMIAASTPDSVHLRSWVPLDDTHHMLISQTGYLNRSVTEQERHSQDDPFAAIGGYVQRSSDPFTRYMSQARLANDYNRDMDLQKNELMIGVPFIGNIQDRAMTEPMGPIYERWNEHLGTTDAMVIFVRRRLLDVAHALRERGVVPENAGDSALNRVRSVSAYLAPEQSWIEATEQSRRSDGGVPVAWAPLPV